MYTLSFTQHHHTRRFYIRYLLVGCIALITAPAWSNPQDAVESWELKRDDEGIQIYTSNVSNSKFKAVKAVMQIPTNLHALTALVQDAESCPDWADLCKEAKVIETVSDTEMYVYTLNDLPWPVSDRDAIAHVIWEQQAEDASVVMHATVAPDKLPKTKGKVRLQYGYTSWKFTPLENGEIAVESFAHVDPGGATPAWLTNRLLTESPFVTLKAMRKLIADGAYKDASIGFITKP